MSTRFGARIEVLLAALLFSTGGAAVKATELFGWQVACGRSLIAAATLAVFVRAWGGRFTRGQLLVALPYAATLLLYVLATKLTTAANAIFLQSTAPLYLLLLSPRWLGEAIRARDLVFMGALAVGLSLFFLGLEAPQRTAPDPFLGNILAAISGFTWALTVAGLRLLARDVPRDGSRQAAAAVRATLLGNLLVALVAAPFALARPLEQASMQDVLILLYLGVVQIALAYVFVTRGVQRLSAFESALLLLVEPVLNTLWTWWIHGEVPGTWSAAGAPVILGATALHTGATARSARRDARRASAPGGDP